MPRLFSKPYASMTGAYGKIARSVNLCIIQFVSKEQNPLNGDYPVVWSRQYGT